MGGFAPCAKSRHRACELRELEGLGSSVADERAVREIGERVKDCIRDRRSCMVETVLSTNKYREDVLEAKRQGSKVALVYVAVSSADLAVERVGMRLRAGGHGVPQEKIRLRYQRSLANLPWFMAHADWALVYCNDRPGFAGRPALIARKDEYGIHIEDADAFPELTKRLAEMISSRGDIP